MDQRLDQRKNLDDLPESNDDFWKDSDKHIYRIEKKECNHEFAHSRIEQGVSAECVKCKAGFILSPGMEIKGKHIYLHGSFIV